MSNDNTNPTMKTGVPANVVSNLNISTKVHSAVITRDGQINTALP
jgi:hypothetical protein